MITVHRYLRAIGFSKIKKRDELQALINEVVERTILDPDKLNKKGDSGKAQDYLSARDIAADEDDCVYAELFLDFVHGAGICVRGEFDTSLMRCFSYSFLIIGIMIVPSTDNALNMSDVPCTGSRFKVFSLL